MAYTNLDPQDFKTAFEQDKDAVILDVRTPAELAEGAIEGHIMIDVMNPSAPEKIKELDKSKSYYVYCRSGNRSGQACNFMAAQGFEKLFNLNGGMMRWNSTF